MLGSFAGRLGRVEPFPVTITPAPVVTAAENQLWVYSLMADDPGEPVTVVAQPDGTTVVPVTIAGPGPALWGLEAWTVTTEGWKSLTSVFVVFIP